MQAINSVLVIANQPSYIEDARRVFTLVERGRRQSVRTWHVYYLQNSRSNDVAYVLQQAFTPGRVTAVPTPTGSTVPGVPDQPSRRRRPGRRWPGRRRRPGSGLGGGGGLGGRGSQGGGLGGGGGLTASPAAPGGAPGQPGADTQDQAGLAAGNPLLGGLGGALDQTDTSTSTATMRIIPNNPNNAILIYGTPEESGQAEAMLRKIDILPLQVLIEAVIAEVTLNDDLQIRHAVLLQVPQRQHRLQQHHGERDHPSGRHASFGSVPWPRRRRPGARRRTVRHLGAAGGDQGEYPVVAPDPGHRQPPGPPAGRLTGALPDRVLDQQRSRPTLRPSIRSTTARPASSPRSLPA